MEAVTHAATPDGPTPASATDTPVLVLADLARELEASSWSLRVLAASLPELLRASGELQPEQRSTWLYGLHLAWGRHGWALRGDRLHDLLDLAVAWCDWTLACYVGEALCERGMLDAHGALMLALALHRQGESNMALERLVHGLLAYPMDRRFDAAYRSFSADLAYAAPRIDGTDWDDDELRLVPLGHQHVDDFAWQYYDPAIAELCCLPQFKNADHWHAWLDEVRGYGDQVVYAVIHRDWGFVGSVSLIVHDDLGFFYYWLGRDFQGQGLGPRAGALLLAHAERHWGLRTCYTKVFASNTPSQRGLAKLGFAPLALPIDAGRSAENLYRRVVAAPSTADVANEARRLFAAMGSRIRVLIPILPRGVVYHRPEQYDTQEVAAHVAR